MTRLFHSLFAYERSCEELRERHDRHIAEINALAKRIDAFLEQHGHGRAG